MAKTESFNLYNLSSNLRALVFYTRFFSLMVEHILDKDVIQVQILEELFILYTKYIYYIKENWLSGYSGKFEIY